MSKKMWRKIFKSKPQKQNQQQLNKINKRNSRVICEEYQQLNELLNAEQRKSQSLCLEIEHEIENGNGKNGNINVFEQQPQQSSFNSTAVLSEAQQEQQKLQHQQQQQQQSLQLSTFSRVRNTFSMRRSSSNNNNNKMRMPNTKSTTMESDQADDDQIDQSNETAPPGPLTVGAFMPVPEHASVGDLSACPCCSRTFNLNALRKHIVFCEKMSKKRKVFDSSRQRREGTSLSTYVLPKNFGLPNAEKAAGLHTPPGVSRESSSMAQTSAAASTGAASPLPTRRKSNADQVRGTARASMKKPATTAAEAPAAAAPPGLTRDRMRSSERSIRKLIQNSALELCPHCDRSFNPKVFDRHVEWCKEKAIQANIKSASTTETNKAKERMEARKQYRPPNLKTKRSLNRNKYSGSTEEQQQIEAEMVAQKQTLSLSGMSSSVLSDNSKQQKTEKLMKAPRPGTPQGRQSPVKLKAITSHNTVTLCVPNASSDEAIFNNHERQACIKPRRKQLETCQEIDAVVNRLRRKATKDTLELSKQDCVEAAPLLPAKSQRRTARPKFEAADKLIAPDQSICTFEELNGLLLRKAGTKICNIKLNINEQDLNMGSKTRSTTSLVRHAHRRPRTRENPEIDLRSLETSNPTSKEKMSSDGYDALHADSDMESNSPRAEIELKLESCTIRTMHRPKKHENLPAIMNSCEPLRALPVRKQVAKEPPRTQLPRIKLKDAPADHYKEDKFLEIDDGMLDLDNDFEYDDTDFEVGQLLKKGMPLTRCYDDSADTLEELESDEEQVHQFSEKLPPLRKRSNSSRRLVLLEQDKEGIMYIKATSSSTSPTKQEAHTSPNPEYSPLNSGISSLTSDKYDPFLSAKRQLEELCSPNSPPDNEPATFTAIQNVTPTSRPTAMSISLTGSLGKQQTTSTTPTTAKTTPASNFRRTSSLRGSRRTPLLQSRPLFSTNYRPTIQRGLSDEGPISNNFLKPEEYDEMPVRAACGNDFHSPRVVRRDTSASNRKHQLKLGVGSEVIDDSNQPKLQTRNVAKTDSLAVFLKYEHELEQLNAKASEVAAISKELTSKELKDKSNNLSKQNSAKNLTINSTQLPPLTTSACTPIAKENENQVYCFTSPLGLEPLSKPSGAAVSCNNGGNGAAMAIKLESIFLTNRQGDYIDPKLINPCDNLHVQQQQSSTGSSNASTTPHQQLSQSRCSSQSTITMEHDQRCHSGDSRNLLKRKMRLGRNQFLYDASPEETYISLGSSADDEANRSSLEDDEQCWQQQQKQLLSNPLTMPNMPRLPTFDDFDFEEFLSSFENENDEEQFPLFRDCRQLLLNHSTQRSFQKTTSTPHTLTKPQTQSQKQSPTQTPTQPPPQSPTQPPAQSPIRSQTQSPTQTQTQTQSETQTQSHTPTAKQKAASIGINSQLIMSPGRQYYTPSTKESYAHRSDDSHKREIFISIETETNAQGHSPISPESLRHMVGNAQTPIDVLHIENGNEPEHAKFSKISDTEDHLVAELDDEARHVHYINRLASPSTTAATLHLPNVKANNAKNAIEKMRIEFKQMGEEFGASVCRNMLQHEEQVHEQTQHTQKVLKGNSHLSPSPSGDSDELSSLDGYPMSSSHSSHRAASSKLSSDSAYGSSNSPNCLSRQREKHVHLSNAQRSPNQLRPHTAGGALLSTRKAGSGSNMTDASTQAQCYYGTLKARQQLYAGGVGGATGDGSGDCQAGYSSSCSELSLPVAQQPQKNANLNYQHQPQQHHQQQPQVQATYNNNTNEHNVKNNNTTIATGQTSQYSLLSNTSNGPSSMSASMKMSKFCYECGSKFIFEHAKFCVECGVKRVALSSN